MPKQGQQDYIPAQAMPSCPVVAGGGRGWWLVAESLNLRRDHGWVLAAHLPLVASHILSLVLSSVCLLSHLLTYSPESLS